VEKYHEPFLSGSGCYHGMEHFQVSAGGHYLQICNVLIARY